MSTTAKTRGWHVRSQRVLQPPAVQACYRDIIIRPLQPPTAKWSIQFRRVKFLLGITSFALRAGAAEVRSSFWKKGLARFVVSRSRRLLDLDNGFASSCSLPPLTHKYPQNTPKNVGAPSWSLSLPANTSGAARSIASGRGRR